MHLGHQPEPLGVLISRPRSSAAPPPQHGVHEPVTMTPLRLGCTAAPSPPFPELAASEQVGAGVPRGTTVALGGRKDRQTAGLQATG